MCAFVCEYAPNPSNLCDPFALSYIMLYVCYVCFTMWIEMRAIQWGCNFRAGSRARARITFGVQMEIKPYGWPRYAGDGLRRKIEHNLCVCVCVCVCKCVERQSVCWQSALEGLILNQIELGFCVCAGIGDKFWTDSMAAPFLGYQFVCPRSNYIYTQWRWWEIN